MKSIRASAPRAVTVLFAAAIVVWALVDGMAGQSPPAAPSAAGGAKILVVGGMVAAPVALPGLLSLWTEARE
jgi:hypothetical protein